MEILATKSQSLKFLARSFSNKPSVPGIVLDIGGVIRNGNLPIKNAAEAIKLLKTPLSKLSQRFPGINSGIPVVLMSNMGGYKEKSKADELNKILGLKEEGKRIEGEDMILSHTPLKEIAKDYKDQYVIVSGIGNVLDIALEYGYNKAITIDEYSVMFPYISRLSVLGRTKADANAIVKRVRDRLGFPENMRSPPQIKGIFVFSQPSRWEENLQVFCDLLISRNGFPGAIRSEFDPQFVKFYLTNPFSFFMDDFAVPRFAEGSFLICLEELFKRQYGIPIETIRYGKPMTQAYKFTERYLRRRYDKVYDINRFYMIGDSPESDIRGTNESGWKSILVKTGVFKGPMNDVQYPATYIDDDVLKAVNRILKLERIID